MMTTSSGLLTWGQSGEYNAVDDREVITALAGLRNGLVKPVLLAAGSGLVVIVAPGWLGVADCGDSTSAVVGSRTALNVTVPAGPATGSATYYLWCDVDPAAATWTVNVITPADAAGRPGLNLGTVTAPAGANTAAAMQLTPATISFQEVEGITLNTRQTGGKTYLYSTKNGMLYVQSMLQKAGGAAVLTLNDGTHRGAIAAGGGVSPSWAAPPGDIAPWTRYHLECSGEGLSPSPAANEWWEILALGGLMRVYPNHSGWAAHTAYYFVLRADVQVDQAGGSCALSIEVSLSTKADPKVGITAVWHVANVAIPNPQNGGSLAFVTNIVAIGGTAESWSNTFQRLGGTDPSPQINPGAFEGLDLLADVPETS